MNNLKLAATENTPEINFRSNGELVIKGRSLPENVADFYNPVLHWINENISETVTMEIAMYYINSSSIKKLLEILKLIDRNPGVRKFSIHWLYEEEDEDILEKGRIMEEILDKALFSFHTIQPSVC
jgi:uncharacterized Fe-S radical SAM superfamily protein PflX